MDVDTDDHSEERITLFGMDLHVMQVVIIEYPVVNSFAGSAVVVNFFIILRASGHRSIETDVPVRFGVVTASIGRRGTFLLAGTGVGFGAGKRTTPFTGMLLFTIPPS